MEPVEKGKKTLKLIAAELHLKKKKENTLLNVKIWNDIFSGVFFNMILVEIVK